MTKYLRLLFLSLIVLNFAHAEDTEKNNIEESIVEAVKEAQPEEDKVLENSTKEDLKKIEEEFDLGENAVDETPGATQIDISPQAMQPKNPASTEQNTPEVEEEVDLEKIISANYFSKATVLITNKITAKSQLLTVNVGASAFFGNIEIFPLKCWKSPSKYNPESKAYIRVVERRIDEDSKNIFRGWFFSSSISLSTMEHPIYEISIIDCTGEKINISK
jgi:hypothetical protein